MGVLDIGPSPDDHGNILTWQAPGSGSNRAKDDATASSLLNSAGTLGRCGSATVIGVRHGRGLDALTRHKPRRRVVTVVTPAAALPGATAHRAHHQRAGKVAAGGWGRVPRGVSWAPR